jgi:chitinase
LYDWTADVGSKLTHVNYAFATITYNEKLDVYHIDSPDPWADMGDCMGVANCWGEQPACLPIPAEATCGGTRTATVNLAPYLGAPSDGSTCATGCINNGGSPVSPRTPPCNANLNTFTHPSQKNDSAPVVPMACGLYNHLLNPKTGVRAKFPQIRFILSLGGWYDTNFFSPATTPKYRAAFIKSVVTFVVAFGWDGIDFDWEYPGYEHGGEPLPHQAKKGDPEDLTECSTGKCQDSDRVNDGKNYAAFLVELKAALQIEQKRSGRHESYLMSIAGAAGQDKLAKQDVKTMCSALDWVNVMTVSYCPRRISRNHRTHKLHSRTYTLGFVTFLQYDMHGSFDSSTNHQTPMKCKVQPGSKVDYCYSVENAIEYYLSQGCRPDQLHVGVPFYAHQYDRVPKGPNATLPGLYQNFTGPSEGTCQQFPTQCVPTFKAGGSSWAGNTYWDSESQASYAYDGTTFYSFDDKRSIAAKAAYLKSKALGGFMYWFVGGDTTDNQLLTAMSDGLN